MLALKRNLQGLNFKSNLTLFFSVSAITLICCNNVFSAPTQVKPAAGIDKNTKVICVEQGTTSVYDQSIAKVLFKADPLEKLKIFQGWGNNSVTKKVRGKNVKYDKVQIASRSTNNVGWIDSTLIKTAGNCPFIKSSDQSATEPTIPPALRPSQTPAQGTNISGLADFKCCNFPLNNRPTDSFLSGMRRFGAGRSGGRRLHAASDLYRFINEPIYAVADGKVVRNLYYFYQDTYALEVVHTG